MKVLQHPPHVIDRHGKVQSFRSLEFPSDNSNDLRSIIKQRAAAIAGIDGSIRLNDLDTGPCRIVPYRADHASCNRTLQASWTADHYDPLPASDFIGVAQFNNGEIKTSNFDDRQIFPIVKSQYRKGVEDLAAGKLDTAIFQVSDDVKVGCDLSVPAPDQAAAAYRSSTGFPFDEHDRRGDFLHYRGTIERRLSVCCDYLRTDYHHCLVGRTPGPPASPPSASSFVGN